MRRLEAVAMVLVGGDNVRVSTGAAWVAGLGTVSKSANANVVAVAIGR